jgi:hypothetical protein
MKDVALNTNPTAPQQATISAFAGKIGHTFDQDYRAQALTIMNRRSACSLQLPEALKTPISGCMRSAASAK